MGLKYLWDTNIVIYYFQKQFPSTGEIFIDDILINNQPAISIITEIELLCWKSATQKDILMLNDFVSASVVYELDQNIKIKAIEIRKNFNLKLPDAVIAASALIYDHVLITRNFSDFNKIPKLKTLNPFEIIG